MRIDELEKDNGVETMAYRKLLRRLDKKISTKKHASTLLRKLKKIWTSKKKAVNYKDAISDQYLNF